MEVGDIVLMVEAWYSPLKLNNVPVIVKLNFPM